MQLAFEVAGYEDAGPVISPSFAPADRDPFSDGIDLDELEDQSLSAGMSASECETQALQDELAAIALEVAIRSTVVHAKGLIDPTTGLVPACRRHDGTSPAVAYIRSSFRLAALRATAKRLRDRALRLRREADRKALTEACCTDVQPKRTAKRTKSVLLRGGKVVPKESAAEEERARFEGREFNSPISPIEALFLLGIWGI